MFLVGGFNKANPITVTGKYSFTFNIDTPSAETPQILTLFWFGIETRPRSWPTRRPVTRWGQKVAPTHVANFGPWTLSSFAAGGTQLTYARNPHLTGSRGQHRGDRHRRRSRGQHAFQLLDKGEIDQANNLSFEEDATLGQSTGTLAHSCASANRYYLAFNYKDSVFNNVLVRQAICLDDQPEADRDVGLPRLRPAGAYGIDFSLSPMAGTRDVPAVQPNVSQAAARQGGLREAPHARAGRTRRASRVTTRPSLAVFLKTQLVGRGDHLEPRVDLVETTTFNTDLAAGNFQIFLYQESPGVRRPRLLLDRGEQLWSPARLRQVALQGDRRRRCCGGVRRRSAAADRPAAENVLVEHPRHPGARDLHRRPRQRARTAHRR